MLATDVPRAFLIQLKVVAMYLSRSPSLEAAAHFDVTSNAADIDTKSPNMNTKECKIFSRRTSVLRMKMKAPQMNCRNERHVSI